MKRTNRLEVPLTDEEKQALADAAAAHGATMSVIARTAIREFLGMLTLKRSQPLPS